MSNVRSLISSLGELYKKLLKQESTEDNSVDFLLENLHEKGEAIRKEIEDE